MADIHQRVASLEERAQIHGTGIGDLRKDIADLRVELRTSFADLRIEIAAVRGDMAYRSDVTDLRTEIAAVRGEMAELRRDMNGRFVAMDQKFTWLVGIQVAGLVAVVGALVGSYYR